MEKYEKSILKAIYTVTMLMFLVLAFIKGGFNYIPLVLGLSSCALIACAHFIIKRFFPKGDKYLLIISAFLAQLGLVMIYRLDSVNTNVAIVKLKSVRQVWWFTIGMAIYILLVVFLPEIKRLEKVKYAYIVAAIALLASTLFLGSEIKGSRNWLNFGYFSIQPSEIAKLFLILYLASAIQDIKNAYDTIKVAIPVFICIMLLVVEKDLGAALIFFGVFMAMLYIGTSNKKYILIGIACFALGGVLSYFLFNHVRIRVDIWLNPWADKSGKGYQILQSLFGIAAGGLFGKGLGEGNPYLIPEAHTDFIFSAISEELGLMGAMAIILLYLLLVYRGLRAAIYAKDNYSRLVAVGISSMIAFQVFVIIGGVTKMIPLTGITLPFVSYGGSSMVLNFTSIGVLQRISESGRKYYE
ncbi:FtsW/RodA/SpoVE family cell cycle protein [Fonticella tunisiensis]|uniref:Cell division protein FtsW (Lipid II flippase) n=1 Tax=Fonticella tunisiensis TaxID=1096341 RepID=A0A4R7KVR0_9CLOT|nr:FtsW/RodA/SpoVE family cell cycle protein [Fonticella tunisiensis]TDT63722.1 cell division protein FtsW (lipid II flippase) [Fonticella tunisiensis]